MENNSEQLRKLLKENPQKPFTLLREELRHQGYFVWEIDKVYQEIYGKKKFRQELSTKKEPLLKTIRRVFFEPKKLFTEFKQVPEKFSPGKIFFLTLSIGLIITVSILKQLVTYESIKQLMENKLLFYVITGGYVINMSNFLEQRNFLYVISHTSSGNSFWKSAKNIDDIDMLRSSARNLFWGIPLINIASAFYHAYLGILGEHILFNKEKRNVINKRIKIISIEIILGILLTYLLLRL